MKEITLFPGIHGEGAAIARQLFRTMHSGPANSGAFPFPYTGRHRMFTDSTRSPFIDMQLVIVNSKPSYDERLEVIRNTSYGLWTESTMKRMAKAAKDCVIAEMTILGTSTGIQVLTDNSVAYKEAMESAFVDAQAMIEGAVYSFADHVDGQFADLSGAEWVND